MATARLDVHVRKGLTDGLQISSVACTGDLWALIMDAGSGLGNQVYKLAQAQFLPKEWIMEQWDRGFYISSVAGLSPPPPPSLWEYAICKFPWTRELVSTPITGTLALFEP